MTVFCHEVLEVRVCLQCWFLNRSVLLSFEGFGLHWKLFIRYLQHCCSDGPLAFGHSRRLWESCESICLSLLKLLLGLFIFLWALRKARSRIHEDSRVHHCMTVYLDVFRLIVTRVRIDVVSFQVGAVKQSSISWSCVSVTISVEGRFTEVSCQCTIW